MSPAYEEYYYGLLRVIRLQEDRDDPESEAVETCFKASLDYWGKVRLLAKEEGFRDMADEITFFKEIKPGFVSYIEYYTYRYHALLFMPTDDPLERKRFWKWEERKIERFYENNFEFCRYIRDGATFRDAEYFLRADGRGARNRRLQGLIHDAGEEMVASQDHLVTMIYAYRLYNKHIQAELEKLSGANLSLSPGSLI